MEYPRRHSAFEDVRLSRPDGTLQLTMDGKQAARLFNELGAEVLVLVHFDSWARFWQHEEESKAELEAEGVGKKIRWLVPGQPTKFF